MKFLPFQASFETVLIRFGLLMAAILIGWFSGQIWMMFLALPIFISALLAIKFERPTKAQTLEVKQGRKDPARSMVA